MLTGKAKTDYQREYMRRRRGSRLSAAMPTTKEMAAIIEAALIEDRLAWLDEHPGKTRRDYNAGLKNGSVKKWRIARAERDTASERRAWLKDHPGKVAADYDVAFSCVATEAEVEAMDEWRRKRGGEV
jgi:hypothetical protein